MHTLMALALQIAIGLTLGNWWLGGLLATLYFAGREVAQAEYRHIESLPSKLRADMPMLGGLDARFWNRDALVADLLAPAAACTTLWLAAPVIAQYVGPLVNRLLNLG